MSLTLIKALPYVALTGVILFLGSCTYKAGQNDVQDKWNQEKKTVADQTEVLKENLRNAESVHRDEMGKVKDALYQTESKFQTDINNIQSTYTARLRTAETRSASYQHQAQSGTAECIRLASYATELDRSLEEGRSLVQELGATIRLRDSQLITLGSHIKADRELLEKQ